MPAGKEHLSVGDNKKKKQQKDSAIKKSKPGKQLKDTAAKKSVTLDPVFIGCLVFLGGDVIQHEWQRQMIKSKWFNLSCCPGKLLNTTSYGQVLDIKPVWIRYLAWYFHELYDMGLLGTSCGKAYIEVTCMLIYCKGNPLSVRYLWNLNCKTKKGAKGHENVKSVVATMIKRLEYLHGGLYTRVSEANSW